MKKTRIIRKSIGILLFSSVVLQSCSDLDEYFETPTWISGSIYEELQSNGDYSIFLQGVERAGLTPILNGKSILTVMAPNNDAMKEYLQETYGVESIDGLSEGEVKKLIGFHVLYYSLDKNKLINFRPNEGDGATEEEQNVNGGLYYKFRTKSQDPISYKNEETKDTAVYHFERLLPVFSYKMFQTKGIDAKANYEYFYPNTGWSGDGGFNIANVNVTEYADIAKNGYIYKIDRVIKPLETIYNELKKAGKYSKFLSLYDKYEYYEADDKLTLENSNNQTLYHHYHKAPLANIDCEWPVTDYRNISGMALHSYSVFAPTNEAMDNFFNDYWGYGGYKSLDEVDSVSVKDLLFNCVYSQSIVFPEEIKNGNILNNSDEVINFDTEDVKQEDRVICGNGVLYGCSVLTPPAKFNSVTGPAYQYKKFSNFLYMLDNSGMVQTLTSNAVDYIMLYPDNEQFETNAGIKKVGDKLVNYDNNNVSSSTMSAYVYGHVVTAIDGNTRLPQSGKKVFATLSPDLKLYWYLKDGKITNSIKHNELLKYAGNTTTEEDVFAEFAPLAYRGNVDGWVNGHTYTYDKLLFEGNFNNVNDSKFITLMASKRTDTTTEFFGWINLLQKAGLISPAMTLDIMTDNCLMFVPVTNAIEQAIVDGKIPGITSAASVGSEDFFDNCTIENLAELQKYIKLYFVPLTTAVITNYPYVGWGEDTALLGGLITLQQEEVIDESGMVNIVSTNVNIYDDGTSLSVGIIDNATGNVNKRVNVTPDYDFFPFVYEDGCVHFIEGVL